MAFSKQQEGHGITGNRTETHPLGFSPIPFYLSNLSVFYTYARQFTRPKLYILSTFSQ